jgi:hypothetical protein
MDNSIYLQFKSRLKEFADNEQTEDKPMRNEALNNYTDSLLREMDIKRLKERISQKQYNLYHNWLTYYCANRHKK